jgi:hypothetical protein
MRRRRVIAGQDSLGHSRQLSVWQVCETTVDALAFAQPVLAGRFQQAQAFACLAESAVRVVIPTVATTPPTNRRSAVLKSVADLHRCRVGALVVTTTSWLVLDLLRYH